MSVRTQFDAGGPHQPTSARQWGERVSDEIDDARLLGVRVYSYDGGWPSRDDFPGVGLWIKRNATDPDPTVGGTGMQPQDVALLAQAVE